MANRFDIENVLGIPVQKAFLIDLTTGEEKRFLFNPAELEETFAVNWAMFESPGFSHKRPQAISCENVRWKLTAIFDQLFYERPADAGTKDVRTSLVPLPDGGGLGANAPSEVEEWRNFMMSLMSMRRVPASGSSRIQAASPTPVHFEWPGLISTVIRIEKAKLSHTIFTQGTARPRVYTMELEVFEDPGERRIFADDVRKQGTIRPWAASSPSRRAP